MNPIIVNLEKVFEGKDTHGCALAVFEMFNLNKRAGLQHEIAKYLDVLPKREIAKPKTKKADKENE